MARCKAVDASLRLLPVVLEAQIRADTFEHALHTLMDSGVDLSGLEAKLKNDGDCLFVIGLHNLPVLII